MSTYEVRQVLETGLIIKFATKNGKQYFVLTKHHRFDKTSPSFEVLLEVVNDYYKHTRFDGLISIYDLRIV